MRRNTPEDSQATITHRGDKLYVYPDGVDLQELALFTVGGCLPYLLALRNEALRMRETPAFT